MNVTRVSISISRERINSIPNGKGIIYSTNTECLSRTVHGAETPTMSKTDDHQPLRYLQSSEEQRPIQKAIATQCNKCNDRVNTGVGRKHLEKTY